MFKVVIEFEIEQEEMWMLDKIKDCIKDIPTEIKIQNISK